MVESVDHNHDGVVNIVEFTELMGHTEEVDGYRKFFKVRHYPPLFDPAPHFLTRPLLPLTSFSFGFLLNCTISRSWTRMAVDSSHPMKFWWC